MVQRMKQLQVWMHRIPIRWRLTLVSLGLLTLLLGSLGVIILLTAEQALLSNEAAALRGQARLAVNSIHGHPFDLARFPGPPPASLPPNLKVPAQVLVQKLANPGANAAILSPTGAVIIPGSYLPLAPLPVTLSSANIQQMLTGDMHNTNNFLLSHDAQRKRQLVVLMPLTDQYHTVALLQISTPTQNIDEFITTLRLILLFGVIGALGLAIALTFPLVSAALNPLVDMERTSRRIAAGALSMRLEEPLTNDEIGHLAVSFNRMVTQLENAFKRQKQFVSDVSHELRTPLTALSGSMEMLLIGADRGDIEASRHLIRGMYTEVQRMHRLVEDLLSLTKLDEGKIVLREDTVDIHALIDKVYDQAQQLAHGQKMSSKVAAHLPFVRVDADRMQQVLLNIMDNALKFTPADGCVTLSARSEEQSSVIIEVQDTGKGIPPEALPYVFDRFYRSDSSRSRSPQSVSGNGLGLAIAKELIEAQGGTITIASTLSKGTTVTIQIPTAQTPASPQRSHV